jgi:hypothetical protein
MKMILKCTFMEILTGATYTDGIGFFYCSKEEKTEERRIGSQCGNWFH